MTTLIGLQVMMESEARPRDTRLAPMGVYF